MFFGFGLRRFLGALPLLGVISILSIAPAAIALGKDVPRPGQPVIVITAPWDNALRVSSDAGGRQIAPGRLESIAMVWSDDPLFPQTLYANGALFVLGGDLSRILCQVE